jgi:ferric-dicitrate binding protein FerR (iron transport regulator)
VGNVELLAGRLNFQIDKMAGSSGFEVRTQAAVMGVRGTTFSVITAPQGEILVTTREGRVEVSDSEGSVSYAQPGQVVEASEENPIPDHPCHGRYFGGL